MPGICCRRQYNNRRAMRLSEKKAWTKWVTASSPGSSMILKASLILQASKNSGILPVHNIPRHFRHGYKTEKRLVPTAMSTRHVYCSFFCNVQSLWSQLRRRFSVFPPCILCYLRIEDKLFKYLLKYLYWL